MIVQPFRGVRGGDGVWSSGGGVLANPQVGEAADRCAGGIYEYPGGETVLVATELAGSCPATAGASLNGSGGGRMTSVGMNAGGSD